MAVGDCVAGLFLCRFCFACLDAVAARDYINSLQLISALVLIVLGLFVAAMFPGEGQELAMVAPAWDLNPKNAPVIFPFLFITIACGAAAAFIASSPVALVASN